MMFSSTIHIGRSKGQFGFLYGMDIVETNDFFMVDDGDGGSTKIRWNDWHEVESWTGWRGWRNGGFEYLYPEDEGEWRLHNSWTAKKIIIPSYSRKNAISLVLEIKGRRDKRFKLRANRWTDILILTNVTNFFMANP